MHDLDVESRNRAVARNDVKPACLAREGNIRKQVAVRAAAGHDRLVSG